MARRLNDRIARHRALISGGWLSKYRTAIFNVFTDQLKKAAEVVGNNGNIQPLEDRWIKELDDVQYPLSMIMAADGYEIGQVETGAQKAITRMFIKSQDQVGIAFGEIEPFIAQKIRPRVREWLAKMTKSEARFQMELMQNIIDSARREGLTIMEIAKVLNESGVATSKWHAEMIARSSTIWNYNEGAMLAYADSGATAGVWISGQGYPTCTFCEELDGTEVPLGESFVPGDREWFSVDFEGRERKLKIPYAIEHPPLHPNCRCAIGAAY